MTAPVKILAFPRYTTSGASSRVRMFQYIPLLRAANINVRWSPLLDDAYVQQLYLAGSRSVRAVLSAYRKRLTQILTAHDHDAVWLQKELFPWVPTWLDLALMGRRPYVVDYDDAVFHNYDAHRSAVVRRIYGSKIDSVMRRAHTVVVGNGYLAARAQTAGARRVEILPSVVDATVYPIHDVQADKPFRIGWIGSPVTQRYLEPLLPVLREILVLEGDTFVTVGAHRDLRMLPGHLNVAWKEETEAAEVSRFDVGVMPLPDEPFERGKCGYKLVQYMACGVPVVASPVGVNRTIVRHGETGFLASTAEEWSRALRMLREDPALRRGMGAAGRTLFEREYSLQSTAPRLVEILRNAAGRS